MVRKVHLNAGLATAAGYLIFFYVKSLIQSNDKLNGLHGLEVVVIGLGMIAFLGYWACKMYSRVLRQFENIVDNALPQESGFDGAVEDLIRFFQRVRQRPVIPDAAEHNSITIPDSYRTQITSIKYRLMVDLQSMKGNLAPQAISATIRMFLAVIAGLLFFSYIKMG
ncbi:hypothetical protein LIER_05350 [Lithospermum erythrorhizon]|uniref:Uncharacterized protein n=1 Tax=Lithospermum erythrorhizon TaxID=34254 RepID=A0AAV3P1K3_LITER